MCGERGWGELEHKWRKWILREQAGILHRCNQGDIDLLMRNHCFSENVEILKVSTFRSIEYR